MEHPKLLSNKQKIIPSTILTGFLGSGKTTYLNYLLKMNPSRRFAIIENEIGEQGIDGDLIFQSTDDIVEMNNGCLCCSLNDNLYDILNDLYLRRNEFDNLIIESTGIADPSGIAKPFLIHPAVKKTFHLSKVICLIDAEFIEDQLSETEEARKQVSFSDVLLINKTDLVSPEYIEYLKNVLHGINPTAQVAIKTENGYPDLSEDRMWNVIKKTAPESSKECDGDHHHFHEHHSNECKTHSHRHNDIVTHSFTFDVAFDSQVLYHSLLVFLTFQAKDIYRVKGIINVENSQKKYSIQSVGKRLGMEKIGEWKNDEKKESKIVFIGKNINPEGLERLLSKCIWVPEE